MVLLSDVHLSFKEMIVVFKLHLSTSFFGFIENVMVYDRKRQDGKYSLIEVRVILKAISDLQKHLCNALTSFA